MCASLQPVTQLDEEPREIEERRGHRHVHDVSHHPTSVSLTRWFIAASCPLGRGAVLTVAAMALKNSSSLSPVAVQPLFPRP